MLLTSNGLLRSHRRDKQRLPCSAYPSIAPDVAPDRCGHCSPGCPASVLGCVLEGELQSKESRTPLNYIAAHMLKPKCFPTLGVVGCGPTLRRPDLRPLRSCGGLLNTSSQVDELAMLASNRKPAQRDHQSSRQLVI